MKTLGVTMNLGVALVGLKDYELALDYHQEALSEYKRVFGKKHPQILMTITNMASQRQKRCTSSL